MKKVIEILGNIALVVVILGVMYVSFKHDEKQRVNNYAGKVK